MRFVLALLFSLIASLAAGLAAAPAMAQDRATLIADSLAITGDSVLIAEGNVEIFYRGQRLEASRLVYDRALDQLTIEGPIRLTVGENVLLLADQAELRADLTEGILTSARLVLNQQLQLAAAQIIRTDGGRYTAMNRVLASSCTVCAGNPTPLWEIRARRVVHDAQEQQIYFEHAQLRFAGVPIFYLPQLRMPDPSRKRATGFLTPSLRTTTALGTGLKFPYFIPLGTSRDLTLTPYLTTEGGRTLTLRYRQAFASGDLTVIGAASRDHLLPGQTRGYFDAVGAFRLPRDFQLTLRGILVSDPAYLLDYGISDSDRLDSRIEIARTRRNEYFSARLIGFQSIRASENNTTLPAAVGDLTFQRRFTSALLGGEGGFQFQTHSRLRTATSGQDGDGDGIADGRDLSRASVSANWRRSVVLGNGMVAAALLDLTADYYDIRQDDIFSGTSTRLFGTAAVELRWPWVKTSTAGVSQTVEPVLQLLLSPGGSDALPNEDSALVEFDEGNLFALNRFPGSDAVERGIRANIGLSYLRDDPGGWSLGITAGRVIRLDDPGQFGAASGLSGAASDWLLAWSVGGKGGLALTNRLQIDDSLDLTKGELRLDLVRPRYAVATGYVYLVADASENRPDTTSELTLDASYDLTGAWTASASTRYDFQANRATQGGLGVSFRNECVDFNLSLSRRFTSSTSVKPTTDLGLTVELLGFGGGSEPGPSRVCRR